MQGFEMVDIPQLEGVRQEQRRHPHGRRRDRPLLLEDAHRHVRADHGRQRLLAARLEAQGERQARDRLRRAELDVGPARDNCDEFIYYDDLIRVQKRTQHAHAAAPRPKKESAKARKARKARRPDGTDKRKQEAFERLVATVTSLETDYDPVWGSLVKQTVKRVYPGFNESYYGYRTFAELLEDAAKEGAIQLELDPQRGNYRVRTALSARADAARAVALARRAPRRQGFSIPGSQRREARAAHSLASPRMVDARGASGCRSRARKW